MRRLFTIITAISIAVTLSARETVERNYIQSRTTYDVVKSSLITGQKWVPYPAYNDREGWDKLTGEYKERIIRNGEKYLNYEYKVVNAMDYIAYETTGDRKKMENTYDSNSEAIATLFAAELAEGKGRFIPQIINGVFHTCEMTSWSLAAHLASLSKAGRSLPVPGDNTLELTQGNIAQMFSWIYYFLHTEFDRIQPEISRRLKSEIIHRELDSYLERDDFWWMGFSDHLLNNWSPWCTSNALICFMLIEDDTERLAQATWKSIRTIDLYLNYIQGDGGIEEGPSYWSHSAGKLYDYLQFLDWLTGGKITIFDVKQVKDMGEYIVRSYIGDDWVVNFADATAKGVPPYTLIYRYGKAVGSSLMTGFASSHIDRSSIMHAPWRDMTRYMETLRYADEMKNSTETYSPSSYTWYPETQFHYMSNSKGMFLAAKGGYNNESHNHNDAGSMILCVDSMPVLIDVGACTYTRQTFSKERYSIWSMQSSYHNLPEINGVSQKNGAAFMARGVKSTPTSFTADISGAYPEDAAVKSWIRSYTFNSKGFQIKDRFALKEAKKANTQHFMTWGDVDAATPGSIIINVNGKKVRMTYDKVAFRADVEDIKLSDTRLSNIWGENLKRISLVARKTQSTGTYTVTVTRIE